MGTSLSLTCVVEILLVTRAGALPIRARNLSGLGEEFLRGVGKLKYKFLVRSGLKVQGHWTSSVLCCVVEILLLGRAGSLPSGACILSSLREDFLRGWWQTNEMHILPRGIFLK